MLSQNFERLGKRDEAVKALRYSTIALIALFIIGYNIPNEWNIPNIAWNIPQILAMIQIAKKFQENDINKHLENGGSLASNWKAFGISLLVILGIVLLVIGASILIA